MLSKELYNYFPNDLYLLRLLINKQGKIDTKWLYSVTNEELNIQECILYDIVLN